MIKKLTINFGLIKKIDIYDDIINCVLQDNNEKTKVRFNKEEYLHKIKFALDSLVCVIGYAVSEQISSDRSETHTQVKIFLPFVDGNNLTKDQFREKCEKIYLQYVKRYETIMELIDIWNGEVFNDVQENDVAKIIFKTIM